MLIQQPCGCFFRTASFLSCLALLSPFSFKCFSSPVKGAFQLSLSVLVRYRTQVVFSVPSQWLGSSRAKPDARYSRNPGIFQLNFAYEAITLCGTAFQRTSTHLLGNNPVHTPHLPCITARDSVCSVLFSVAPNNRIAIAFFSLRVLKCFNSPRSLSFRTDSGTLGSKTACVSPRNFAACRALRQRLSLVIH
jgi:hypothetical protein